MAQVGPKDSKMKLIYIFIMIIKRNELIYMKKYFTVTLFLLLFLCSCIYQKNNKTEDSIETEKEINEREIINKDKDDIKQKNLNTLDAKKLLFGKWEIIDVYTVLPSVFGYNSYENFANYNTLTDDPSVQEFIRPYNEICIGKTVEFSENKIIIENEIINNPNYIFEKYDGELYSNNNFWYRYRPFHDYFKDYNYDSYYYFDIYNDYNQDALIILPRGFIISKDYIVCPVHDDWIFYVLKRQ